MSSGDETPRFAVFPEVSSPLGDRSEKVSRESDRGARRRNPPVLTSFGDETSIKPVFPEVSSPSPPSRCEKNNSDAAILFADCRNAGVLLWIDGDQLHYDAPAGEVADDLLRRLRSHKDGLMGLVRENETPPLVARLPGNCFGSPLDSNGWPIGSVDAGDLPACESCQSIEPWQDDGGSWHCRRCDPPSTKALRFWQAIQRIRARNSRAIAIGSHADGGDSQSSLSDARETSAEDRGCRCGSRDVVVVAIHGGRSERLDCAKCGRFVDFAVWYGERRRAA